MNMYRRLLAAVLITLSCLFAIQSAGAVNHRAAASGDDSCTNIGPTVFSLGMGTSAFSVPACFVVEAASSDDMVASADACTNVGPMIFKLGLGSGHSQSSVMSIPACFNAESGTSGGSDKANVANDDAAAASDAPDLLRGRPSNIGPTI